MPFPFGGNPLRRILETLKRIHVLQMDVVEVDGREMISVVGLSRDLEPNYSAMTTVRDSR